MLDVYELVAVVAKFVFRAVVAIEEYVDETEYVLYDDDVDVLEDIALFAQLDVPIKSPMKFPEKLPVKPPSRSTNVNKSPSVDFLEYNVPLDPDSMTYIKSDDVK